MTNSSRTAEEELQAAISEPNPRPGIGNAVLPSFRKIRRHIWGRSPMPEGGDTQTLSMMISGFGPCLVCIAHAGGSKDAIEADVASAV